MLYDCLLAGVTACVMFVYVLIVFIICLVLFCVNACSAMGSVFFWFICAILGCLLLFGIVVGVVLLLFCLVCSFVLSWLRLC